MEELEDLKGLLIDIEKGGFYSAATVLTAGNIQSIYDTVWAPRAKEARPDLESLEARLRIVLQALRNGEQVTIEEELPDYWKNVRKGWTPTRFWTANNLGGNYMILLRAEVLALLELLKETGFGVSSLPVFAFYNRVLTNSESLSNSDSSVYTSDWFQDDVSDLLHYAVSSRNKVMNTRWKSENPLTVYKTWFAQAKEYPVKSGPSRENPPKMFEFFLYRGVFIIGAQDVGPNRILRTCHLQRYRSGDGRLVRHDGFMFNEHDKFTVIGFRRDYAGNQSPHFMILDGRTHISSSAGLYEHLTGWQSAYDVFEEVRNDGLIGTSIHMEFDYELNGEIAQETKLEDVLHRVCADDHTYRKRAFGLQDAMHAQRGYVEGTNGEAFLSPPERTALHKLAEFDESRLQKILELIHQLPSKAEDV